MERVNINRAPLHILENIIHIGPTRGEMIMDMREGGYKFKDVYELSQILGLGSKRMSDIINQGIATV